MSAPIEDLIAEVAHEANRAYCAAIGDNTQVEWRYAPLWQKDSAIAGVKAVMANPNITPEETHAGWMKQKVADGWVYGPVKDAEKREHPCMAPYDQLPVEQRAKDHIFTAIARTIITQYEGN